MDATFTAEGAAARNRSRSSAAPSTNSCASNCDALFVGRLATSVNPMPKSGSSTSCSGSSAGTPSATRMGALSCERESAGQKRLVVRAK